MPTFDFNKVVSQLRSVSKIRDGVNLWRSRLEQSAPAGTIAQKQFIIIIIIIRAHSVLRLAA